MIEGFTSARVEILSYRGELSHTLFYSEARMRH